MSEPIFEITKAAAFDAAHFLEEGPPDHRYRRMHGHSFQVEASVRGQVAEGHDWVADLGELDAQLKALAAELDHGLLNDHAGLEKPTLERLCLHFAGKLRPQFPGLSKIVVSRPTVGERCEMQVA